MNYEDYKHYLILSLVSKKKGMMENWLLIIWSLFNPTLT